MLSHYNFSKLVRGNPHHEDVRSGKMSFLEYAEALAEPNSIGTQFSFFDDTGTGSFARTGAAPVTRCLHNLLNKVSLFGMTDRFSEFCTLFGYLLRCPNIAVAPENDTAGLNEDSVEFKASLTKDEKSSLDKLYGDDVWFFEQAREEYERRVSDPRIQAVFKATSSHLRQALELMQEIERTPDPADPRRLAFSPTMGERLPAKG